MIKKRTWILPALAMVLGFAGIQAAGAATLSVCQPAGTCTYDTIQAAIDAAVDGDIVEVGDGTYLEAVTLTKEITVRSLNGPQTTVIDGNGAPTTVFFNKGVLDGFTVTGASSAVARGGGISMQYGVYGISATINNCIVENNAAGEGGGIYIDSVETIITNTIVRNNTANRGGGIYALRAGNFYVTDCDVVGNTSTYGGGLYFFNLTRGELLRSSVVGNSADYGGGFYVAYQTSTWARLHKSWVVDNHAAVEGGAGWFSDNARLLAYNSIFARNSSVTPGAGGIFAQDAWEVVLVNSTVTDNTGTPLRLVNTRYSLFSAIVYGNENLPEFGDPGCCSNLGFSDIEGGYAGTAPANDIIDADPLFRDPVGGDWDLTSNSPCVDTGAYSANPGPTDLVGRTRPLGADWDMGAYEFYLEVTKAQYTSKKDKLVVNATSMLGTADSLTVVGYGAMTASGSSWTLTVEPAGGSPGATITVCGLEGCISAPVTQ